MFSECAELAIFLYVFFAIFWYLRKKQSDLEKKKTNSMMRRWDHNVILFRGIFRFLSAVCRRWFPGQSGDRTCLLDICFGRPFQLLPSACTDIPLTLSCLEIFSTKHVRSPDWPGNHRLHTADKKGEMPRNKMTL